MVAGDLDRQEDALRATRAHRPGVGLGSEQLARHGDDVELHLEDAGVLERVERVVVEVPQTDLLDQLLVLVVVDVVDEAEGAAAAPVDVLGVAGLDVGEELLGTAAALRDPCCIRHGRNLGRQRPVRSGHGTAAVYRRRSRSDADRGRPGDLRGVRHQGHRGDPRARTHPEIVVVQDPALPWGGRHEGHDGLGTFMLALVGSIDSAVTIDAMFQAGDSVVQHGRTAGTVRATGVAFDIPECHIWRVVDGLAVEARYFIDSAAMLDVLAAEA